MKIAIFGYYNLADGYLACSNSLEKKGHETSFFPYMRYKNDKISIDIIKKTIEHFVNCEIDENEKNNVFFYEYMKLPNSIPDVLFFWIPNNDISEILSHIKSFYKGKIVWHNWDPTYSTFQHQHWINQANVIKDNLKYYDLILSVNPEEIEHYKSLGFNAEHCYSGFDDDYSFSEENDDYKCDVSAVITNLYVDDIWNTKNKKVNRKNLIDKLYEDETINLNIYGTENFKNVYPKSYKRRIPYKDCNKVFFNSKINLCIHAVATDFYLSERAPQIIGSGGLLLSDNRVGLDFIENEDYILAENIEDTYNTIKELLNDEEKRLKIVENGYNKRELLVWNKIADRLENCGNSKIKFYFLHIPRSGGSSMYNLLKNYFPELNYTNNGNLMNDGEIFNWFDLSSFEIEKLYTNTNILFNELNVKNSCSLCLNVKYFTIIRNPYERLLSSLQNSYVNKNLDITFEEYIFSRIEDINSLSSFFLLNVFTENDDMDDKFDLFYKNVDKFTIFNLEDPELSNKLFNFFKDNANISIEQFPICHEREINDKLPTKIEFKDLSENIQEEIKKILENDFICYEYLLKKCV